MGLVQLVIDFLLGPITLFDVLTNIDALIWEFERTVQLLSAGDVGYVLSAFFTGKLLWSKAVAGVLGTLFWLGVLGGAAS